MVLGLEGRGDGRGYRWEAVLTEQEGKLKGEVSILDLYSSVTSWGHLKRAPPTGKEPKLFGLFSLFAFRERQARVNTVSTQLFLVCVCSLHWVRLHGNHRNKNVENVFFEKKKKEQEQQGTAAKYTHKKDSFWWYLQSRCEKRKETMTGSSSTGRDDLHICDYLYSNFFLLSLLSGWFIQSSGTSIPS